MIQPSAAPFGASRQTITRTVSRDSIGTKLTGEEIVCSLLFGFLAFNGIPPMPALTGGSRLAIDIFDSMFCLGTALLFILNRARIHWEFRTIRSSFLFLCITVASPLWGNISYRDALVPIATSVGMFLYACFIADRLSLADLSRMLVWSLTILLAASIVVSVFLPRYGIDSGELDPSNAGAWQGVFAQKNTLGTAVAIATAAALGLKPHDSLDRVWRWSLFVLIAICAVKSQSRETWVAIAFLLVFSIMMRTLRTLEPRSRLPIIVFAISAIVLAGVLVYLNLDAVLHLMGRDRTATGRTEIWAASWGVFLKRPWFGYGLYGLWHTRDAWDVVVRVGWDVTSSHNNYLEVLLSYGIVGFIIYLPIILFSLLYMLRALLNYDLRNLEVLIYVMVVILVFSFSQSIIMMTPSIGFVLLIYCVSRLEQVERSGFMRLSK
jgi:exopolysaccharide production protein ExoQ